MCAGNRRSRSPCPPRQLLKGRMWDIGIHGALTDASGRTLPMFQRFLLVSTLVGCAVLFACSGGADIAPNETGDDALTSGKTQLFACATDSPFDGKTQSI